MEQKSASGPLTTADSQPAAVEVEPGSVSPADGSAASSQKPEAAVADILEGSEAAVLETLSKEAAGLTVRQIQARLSLAPGEVDRALQRLWQRGLVSRLNTIVPSYLSRRVDSE